MATPVPTNSSVQRLRYPTMTNGQPTNTMANTKPLVPAPPVDQYVKPPMQQTMVNSGIGAPIPNRPVGSMGDIQSQIQRNLPFTPNNGNPNGANNMPGRYPVPQRPQQGAQMPSQARRAYLNNVSGQQSDLGRYRPPTLAGNGNDPMNWNDYGGYDYNLPSAYGPTPNTPNSQGPYGGYPSYLQPNWMYGVGSAPRPLLPGGG